MQRAVSILSRIDRRCAVSLLLAVVPAMASANAKDAFPYTAYVTHDDAHVHSGPGKQFYATQRLSKHTAVEVYHHVAGGWCAIRPPAGSFSWVDAQHLEITEDAALARVINVPAKTRVGSSMSDVHDVEYVSLREGEVVEVLGSKMLRETPKNKPRRWFKVAPPAGEFRWIHERELSRANDLAPLPETKSPPASTEHDASVREVSVSDAELDRPIGSGVATELKTYPLDGPRAPESIEPVNNIQKASFHDAPSEEEPLRNEVATHVNPVTWQAVPESTDVLTAPEPRSFDDRLTALNVMLSRAVLADVRDWELAPVKEQAQRLLQSANNSQTRQLVESLLSKIQDFDTLQQRNRSARQTGRLVQQVAHVEVQPHAHVEPGRLAKDLPVSGTVHSDFPRIVSPPPVKAESVELRPEVDNSVFDATGTLIAVRSRRSDIPRYALTDAHGRITRFVSTSNGDSLTAFVSHQVGIIGKSGLVRRLNKPHIVASRVVQLKK